MIYWDSSTNQYRVRNRLGFTGFTKAVVDYSTTAMQLAIPPIPGLDPLGPVERKYSVLTGHDQPTHRTMRAHHVSDHEIQQMVCDYMNGQFSLPTLLDRLGTLYQTSWIDLIVTPRIMVIWTQWISSCISALTTCVGSLVGTRKMSARLATDLAHALSSSVANLRIGHGPTDSVIGNAVAPHIRRGGMVDLTYYFMLFVNRQALFAPTLSFETSVVQEVWSPHFTAHPPSGTVIGNVFAGAVGGNIYISEALPPGGIGSNNRAVTPMPQRYPATRGVAMYAHRIGRSAAHIIPLLLLLWWLVSYFKLKSTYWDPIFGGDL